MEVFPYILSFFVLSFFLGLIGVALTISVVGSALLLKFGDLVTALWPKTGPTPARDPVAEKVAH